MSSSSAACATCSASRHERGGRRLLLGGLFALGLAATPVAAAEVVTDVNIDGQVIHFELEAVVNATAADVSAILHDYDHLAGVFPLVVSSQRLDPPHAGVERVATRIRGCILFFCRELSNTLDIREQASGWHRGVSVAAHSDMKFGHFHWRIDPVDAGHPRTRIRLGGRFQPELRMPPVIGAGLMRRVIERELRASVRRVEEALAAPEAPAGPAPQ